MISSLEDYVSFLSKHNMSGDQFLFCCLIYEKKFNLIYKIFNERDGFNLDELRDLEDRGYVINLNKEDDVYADMYAVTQKFTDSIYGEEYSLWEELINVYPQFIFIEGKRIPAQSTDLDQLRTTYFAKIGKNILKHKRIIKLLQFGIESDLVNMGIEKWVRGEQWKALESLYTEKPKADGHAEKEF